jgi:hypothetical protein
MRRRRHGGHDEEYTEWARLAARGQPTDRFERRITLWTESDHFRARNPEIGARLRVAGWHQS